MKKKASVIFLVGVLGPGLGLLGRWNWFFDLFNHFRVQFTALLFAGVVLLLLAKCFKRAAIAGMILVYCVLSISSYLFFGVHSPPSLAENRASIFYANVYTANTDYESVVRLIQKRAPDILVFSEVNQTWEDHLKDALQDYPVRHSVPREDNFGLSIFSKIPMSCETIDLSPAEVPSFRCSVEHQRKRFVLWATHPLPPVGAYYWRMRNEQLRELSDRVRQEKDPVVVAGDLNTTPWTFWFQELKKSGLKDSAEGFGIQASWPSMWPRFLRVPIDHLLVSSSIQVLQREVLEDIGSDHYPVETQIIARLCEANCATAEQGRMKTQDDHRTRRSEERFRDHLRSLPTGLKFGI